jgi:SnoaL-like protein
VTLLDGHVERFNEGARTGNFSGMVAALAQNAEMRFEGIPVGPFHGRDAIGEAYRTQPPDDELVVLEQREEDGELVATYAWASEPDVPAGELRLTGREGAIDRVVIRYGFVG